MRVELEPAYILHTRPYRETSLLVYALTQEHGLMHMAVSYTHLTLPTICSV